MTRNLFPSKVAYQPSTNSVATNTTGSVYDLADTVFASPLTVYDLGGIAYSGNLIPVTASGLVYPFQVDNYLHVAWHSAGYTIELFSFQGLETELAAAQLAAQTAQIAAQVAEAQVAAYIAGGGGGGGGTSSQGDHTLPAWSGSGAEPTRIYEAGEPLAGQAIPTYVCVKWPWKTAPTYAIVGDEWLVMP